MAEDRFLAFAAGVQAMRRLCEGIGVGMGGALGVAAEPYPYQIATTKLILSDTRIRHLIADEVGMGKTVQSLMILNALRRQKPGHRTVILTPPRLMDQWHKECWTRAHVNATVFDGTGSLQDGLVRIINPQTILARGDGNSDGFETFSLDPDFFDLLIVDEPQLMPVAVMDVVQRESRSFRQVLLLSASPRLGEKDSRTRILSILEPERTSLAEAADLDVDAYVQALEEDACKQIVDAGLDGAEAFERFARNRRIVRSTRKQWRIFFPERRYEALATEPNDADVKRLQYGLEWLKSDTADRDHWSAAQRLHRGSRSVRPFLSGYDLSDSEAGRRALEQCDTGPGDSRLDTLLDLLRTIWEHNPDEQVVLVAGDNPTIDFVSRNIRRYFDPAGERIGISTIRRQSGGANTELENISEMQQAMARFSEGEDRVLFVGDWIQAGLNLHYYAKNIIFYNLPWEQHAVDQLIGRLDRLRPNGLFKGENGRKFEEICIWVLVQPDSPESRILAGLERLGVFLEPMPPVPPETDVEIRECLEALASGRGVSKALSSLEAINRSFHEAVQISKLEQYAPAQAELAKQQYEALKSADLPEPVISSRSTDTFTQRSESALLGWLEFLKRSQLLGIGGRKDKVDPDVHFSTLWYTDSVRKVPPAIRLDEVEGGNWMSDHVPFICRLKDLHRPPLMTVHTDDGEPEGRPLRFLSHGDSIHDDLIEKTIQFARTASAGDPAIGETIRFDSDNGAATRFRSKPVLASAALADPIAIALPSSTFLEFEQEALQIVRSAPGERQKARLQSLLDLATEWWNADRRWFGSQLEPIFETAAFFLDDETWKVMPSAALKDLLKADVDRKETRFPKAYGNPFRLDSRLIEEAVGQLRGSHRARTEALWREQHHRLQGAVSRRLAGLAVEQDDLVRLLQLNVERAWRRAEVRDERQQQMLTGQAEAAERILKLAETAVAARTKWLEETPKRVETPEPDWLGTILFRPVPYQDY
jgi:ATP-dependent helicase HepA